MTEPGSSPVDRPRAARRRFALAFLVAGFTVLFVARETGVVSLTLHSTQSTTQHTTTSMRSKNGMMESPPERPAGEPIVDRDGLAFFAPRGPFTDACLAQIPWIPHVRGFVEVRCEPPSAWLPLWKSTDLHVELTAMLFLDQAAGGAPVQSNVDVKLDGTWRMVGIASRRNFLEKVGAEVGQVLGKALLDEVANMQKQ